MRVEHFIRMLTDILKQNPEVDWKIRMHFDFGLELADAYHIRNEWENQFILKCNGEVEETDYYISNKPMPLKQWIYELQEELADGDGVSCNPNKEVFIHSNKDLSNMLIKIECIDDCICLKSVEDCKREMPDMISDAINNAKERHDDGIDANMVVNGLLESGFIPEIIEKYAYEEEKETGEKIREYCATNNIFLTDF